MSKKILSASLLVAATLLSGCRSDDMALDDAYVSSTGSERYPIKYANGRAYTKPCGDWSEDLANTGKNELMPNHGCAVQANIAAMLADPKDIVAPNKVTPAHSAVGVAAIRKQQTGQSQTGFGSLFSIF